MGSRIGIIAGGGAFPLYVLEEAHKQGYECVVAAIKGEAEINLKDKVHIYEWFEVNEIMNVISFFKRNNVKEAVFAGKVNHRIIYGEKNFEENALGILKSRKDKSPTTLIKALIDFMLLQGIKIKEPTQFITHAFCSPGALTNVVLSPSEEEDIAFGLEIAKKIADLDIGQTVIVKNKAIVAIEGMEGTDEAIRRGGKIAGKGTVVVKVSRTNQDSRIDLPAVGLNTVKSLVDAKARVLCFEARKIPFFQKEQAISLAETNNISIIAKQV
ncbi:MAG: UDP-2,3-diacylglucosamine diphosphatase LpxI [Acidobacteriota bacterium]|nr:UDP-2,3-diacylglucosamine diphosphatase LpxI [Acidobacteriota bacterium]